MRLPTEFSAVAARTHVSDSAVPWHGASSSYNQVSGRTGPMAGEQPWPERSGFQGSQDSRYFHDLGLRVWEAELIQTCEMPARACQCAGGVQQRERAALVSGAFRQPGLLRAGVARVQKLCAVGLPRPPPGAWAQRRCGSVAESPGLLLVEFWSLAVDPAKARIELGSILLTQW